MKKAKILAATLILFASCKERIVYVQKPVLNDTTVLKAELKVSEWKAVFNTIQAKSVALYNLKDTAEKRKSIDTIFMAINFVDKNLGDTNRNPILKK